MKKVSLIDIINGRYNINEELKTYQFYKDDKDKEPVEIEADDEKEADEKIKQITKKDPKKVTKWRKTKPGEKPDMTEADDEDDYAPFDQDEWDRRFADDEDEDGYDSMPSEPQEEDIVISDSRRGYSASIVGGRSIGDFEDMEAALDAVKKWKEKNKYWPTTWWVSDHGNAWPIDDEGNEIKESKVNEENVTSNLDGGEGQVRTPFAFQHKPATRKEKQREYSRATSSTGFGVVGNTSSKYSVKLESMYKRVNQVIQESTVVGLPVVGSLSELKAKDPANKNREKVALKTLTMNPAMVGIMGGGGVDEAVKFLMSIGYTAKELNKMADRNVAEARSSVTPGAWVVYVEDERGVKTKVVEKPSYGAAKRVMDGLKNDPKYSKVSSWGMTNKADWDAEDEAYAKKESIREGRYTDWANDPASTSKQKINKSIQEVNRRLYEIERMVNHVSRLKTESGLQQDAFWKQTMVRFGKISERLLRVGTKMRELNK